jgi:hypothetical protein
LEGVPCLVSLHGDVTILDLDKVPIEALTSRFHHAFHRREMNSATLRDMAIWLKMEYALASLF